MQFYSWLVRKWCEFLGKYCWLVRKSREFIDNYSWLVRKLHEILENYGWLVRKSCEILPYLAVSGCICLYLAVFLGSLGLSWSHRGSPGAAGGLLGVSWLSWGSILWIWTGGLGRVISNCNLVPK